MTNKDNALYKHMYQPCIVYQRGMFQGRRRLYCTRVFKTSEEAEKYSGEFRESLILSHILHPKEYRDFEVIQLKIKVG